MPEPNDPTNDWNTNSLTRRRIVAFVDILGFTNAVMSVRPDEQWRFGEYYFRMQHFMGCQPQYDTAVFAGAYEFHKPRMTAFSDCYVFSFPFGVFDPLANENPRWPIDELASRIGFIFHNAFQIGCLVRGGITIGHLAHDNQIVLGPGLIEAYHLESKIAKWPRVILSEAAVKYFGQHPYLYNEPAPEGEEPCTCPNFVKASTRWHHGEGYAQTIMRERVLIGAKKDGAAFAKWVWLNARLEGYLSA